MNTNTLKRFALLVVLSLTSYGLWAQIPSGYYNGATGKTGEELKVALHDIIKGHTTISYQQIWNAFWSTDNKGNNVVWDMYSDGADYSYNYYTNGNYQCGEYEQEGDCYNREHSWPKSWFSGSEETVPGRDLHHVFPTDGFVNAQRSSYPYGEVQSATWTSQNGSKLGACKSSLGYSGIVFEPIDEYKGDFARALMYMSVRYYSEDDDWGSSDMTSKSIIEDWAINMLLNWSDNDPVSQKEIDRNNVVYGIQSNRNPFIDHPEYARMIWDPNWDGSGNIGNGDFVKVTSSDEITDGDYLIVCENNGVAFNGALNSLDAAGNTIGITITGSVIASSEVTNAAVFTIASRDNGYSIKSASGYYIGQTSNNNGLASSTTTVYSNTLSVNDGNVDIVSFGAYMRYNASSGQERFRYFKSSTYSGQQAIQLYKKTMTYSITLASVANGSISASAEEAVEGASITLTSTPDLGYEFDHWLVTDASNQPVAVMDNQFEMPASNVTVSAVFVYVGEPFVQQYYLVTSTDQLVVGRTYLIVNTEYNKALGKTQNPNNRTAADVIIESDIISTLGDACELTLGGQTGAWTLYDATNNSGYLYAAGGSANNNYLKTQTTLTTAGKWTITLNNNKATIKTIDSGVKRHTIMYNNTGNIFSCYASGQKDICLFIRSEEYDHVENEAIANLFSFDSHTVHSGAMLTVSGTATCNDVSHLTLEDGAQFVHHNNDVKATFKKSIDAYTTDGGWYTIAAPFASYMPSGTMIADNYDLYAYDEDADLEWLNYKSNATGFAMEAGKGYLYAHNPGTVLRMAGTLNSGDYTQMVNLSYASSNTNLKGFNLLGNPTAHDIIFSKTGDVSDGYYYLANSEDWEYATSNTVPVGRGFLVKANAANQTVTLNPQSKGGDNEKGQYICLSIGEEKAYVKLDEGVSMPLLSLKGEQASLYLTCEGKQFVMLVRDDAPSLDLNFKARRNGEQTLKVDLQGNALDYLHLIDNKTGADVDLLQTPSYTFNATTDDYTTRFRLLFKANAEDGLSTGSGIFAYVLNGEIIITDADACDASLQIVDIMGRIIYCTDAARHVSTAGMPSGVYVLRLISGDKVKTQKIVVN